MADLPYEKTEFGVWPAAIGIAVLVILVSSAVPAIGGDREGAAAGTGSFLGLLLLLAVSVPTFSFLTIQVDEVSVKWQFGCGFPRGSIATAEITSAETVAAMPLGFGIRVSLTGGDTSYTVGTKGGVRLYRVNAAPVMLGSNEPDRLAAAISLAVQKHLS